MGGFAWQNTELVPTYWLWLYFIRTGREDIYTMAEAMARHCGEVDMSHFGPLKGIGSRHNVRHWGCSCKEPRVSMARYHRFYYYLTGDYRIGCVLDDAKDADTVMGDNKPFVDEAGEVQVRVGPDWISFVSNWMTAYERTLDVAYRKKIEQGIAVFAHLPMGLLSGPGFGYNIQTVAAVRFHSHNQFLCRYGFALEYHLLYSGKAVYRCGNAYSLYAVIVVGVAFGYIPTVFDADIHQHTLEGGGPPDKYCGSGAGPCLRLYLVPSCRWYRQFG